MQHAYKGTLAALEGSSSQNVELESRKEGDTREEAGSESKPVRSQEHTALLNKLTSVESIMKERLLTIPFEEQEMKSKLTDIIDRE